MRISLLLNFAVIELITCAVSSYKILVVFPAPSFSHFRLGSTLARGLAEAGHDVTILGPLEDDYLPENGTYTNVYMKLIAETSIEHLPKFFELSKLGAFLEIVMLSFLGNMNTKGTFEDPSFQELISSNKTFDVVIMEQFLNDGLKAIACHYNAPLIMFSSVGTNVWTNSISGNPAPPSYIPDLFVKYGSSMTLWERTFNSLLVLLHTVTKYTINYPAQNAMVEKYFPHCPDVETMSHNVSLFLLNAHQSFSQPVPQVPSMINIGGFHLKHPNKLPDDLLNIMTKAEHGVVYFSLGSTIKPSEMKPHFKEALLNSLGRLNETVLWKYDEDLQEISSNIVVRRWFPQMDILAHPNVKVFITHGGLLSTIETLYYGVPVLALPVFGDQRLNAAKAVAAGYGVSLHFDDITEAEFSRALNEVLNNPKFGENAKKISALMHDRPMKPMDLAVYWTEFVVRHGGAPHLKVAAANMPWYKYLLIDVMAISLLIPLSFSAVSYLIVRKVFCRTPPMKMKIK